MKPSSRFFAKAIPRGGGFNGQFSAPGLVPDLVSVNGKPELFDTEDAAKLAAYEALEIVLNQRLLLRMRFERFQRMSAEELSTTLDKIDLTPTELGRIMQSEQIMHWLDGSKDIPHVLRVLLGLFEADPRNIERAEAITDDALIERTPT